MRLDKYLSETGFGTRSEVKKLIRGGSVTVNGIAASKPDLHIDELSDRVCVGGNEVKYRKFIYLRQPLTDTFPRLLTLCRRNICILSRSR